MAGRNISLITLTVVLILLAVVPACWRASVHLAAGGSRLAEEPQSSVARMLLLWTDWKSTEVKYQQQRVPALSVSATRALTIGCWWYSTASAVSAAICAIGAFTCFARLYFATKRNRPSLLAFIGAQNLIVYAVCFASEAVIPYFPLLMLAKRPWVRWSWQHVARAIEAVLGQDVLTDVAAAEVREINQNTQEKLQTLLGSTATLDFGLVDQEISPQSDDLSGLVAPPAISTWARAAAVDHSQPSIFSCIRVRVPRMLFNVALAGAFTIGTLLPLAAAVPIAVVVAALIVIDFHAERSRFFSQSQFLADAANRLLSSLRAENVGTGQSQHPQTQSAEPAFNCRGGCDSDSNSLPCTQEGRMEDPVVMPNVGSLVFVPRLLQTLLICDCLAALATCFVPESMALWSPMIASFYSVLDALHQTATIVAVMLHRTLRLEEHASLSMQLTAAVDAADKKQRFMRYVLHETRVPLHSVILGLELLSDEINGDGSHDSGASTSAGASSGAARAASVAAASTAPAPIGTGRGTSTRRRTKHRIGRSWPMYSAGVRVDSGCGALGHNNVGSSMSANELLAMIKAGADSMSSVVNSVLTLSSIEAHAFKVDLQPADLRTVLQAVRFQLSPWAEKIGAKVQLHVDPTLPDCLLFDRARMSQVITNLGNNALKWVSENGTGVVSISADVQGYNKQTRTPHTEPEASASSRAAPAVRSSASPIEICQVRISVSDNGAGIPDEEQAKLFQAYHQIGSGSVSSGTCKKVQGTGLGLAIAKEIVTRHGGSIWCESEVGKGSSFIMDLPLQMVDASYGDGRGAMQAAGDTTPCDDVGSKSLAKSSLIARSAVTSGARLRLVSGCATPSTVPVGTAAPGGRQAQASVTELHQPSFLVVDDDSSNRKLLVRLLKKVWPDAAVVDEAANGQVGVDRVLNGGFPGQPSDAASQEPGQATGSQRLYQPRHYDAILMDGNMPVMDGYQATAELRSRGFTGCIVGVTGNALDEDRDRFITAGADAVLTKPVSASNLKLGITGLLQEANCAAPC